MTKSKTKSFFHSHSPLALVTLALLPLAVNADSSMVDTGETGYTLRKKDGKTIITTTTTTTIYEKKTGKPGVIKKITTKIKYINDRKNKKSSTETKLIKTEKPVKKRKKQTSSHK